MIPTKPPIELDRCPLSYVTDETRNAFFLYGHYVEGRFPLSGGVLDQIYTGMEAFKKIEEYLKLADRK